MFHKHGHAVIPGKLLNIFGRGNVIAARIVRLHLHGAIDAKGENRAACQRIVAGKPRLNRDGVFAPP